MGNPLQDNSGFAIPPAPNPNVRAGQQGGYGRGMQQDQWAQSASPVNPWSAPQQQPNYHDALSQAWHVAYSRNNPVDYERNYGGDPSSPYYAEGAAAADAAAAAKMRQPFLPGMARGADPDVDFRRETAARLALPFINPLAGGLMAAREGVDTGDFTGAILPAATAAFGPAKAAAGLAGLAMLAPTSTESDAAEIEKLRRFQADPHGPSAQVTPMPPDRADIEHQRELEALQASKAALAPPKPATRTDVTKLQGRENYGARTRASQEDAADQARYEREMATYRQSLQKYDDQIAALPDKYAAAVKAWNEAPFVKRNPWALGAVPAVAAAAGAAIPYGVQKALTANALRHATKWENALNEANALLQGNPQSGIARADIGRRVGALVDRTQGFAKDAPMQKLPFWANMAAGLPEGFAASNFPLEYDFGQPPDSEAHRDIGENFSSPVGYLLQAMRLGLAGGSAFGAQKWAARNLPSYPIRETNALARTWRREFPIRK